MRPLPLLLLLAVGLLTGCGGAPDELDGLRPPDPARGRVAMLRYGCGTCHVVPGIGHARGTIGPSLEGLLDRKELAGAIPNTRDNLVLWIRNPRAIRAQTGMPTLGVSKNDANDIIAYLYEQAGRPLPPSAEETAPAASEAVTPAAP